jgi:hypothetical protein
MPFVMLPGKSMLATPRIRLALHRYQGLRSAQPTLEKMPVVCGAIKALHF